MKRKLCAAALFAGLAIAPSALAQAGAGTNAANDTGPQAHASASAEAFVAENIAQSLAILNNPALTEQQRSLQFETLLLTLTDMKRIAVFTLGPYAKTAPQADQDAFVAAFQIYSEAVYRSYFNRFSGQKLAVTGSSQRAPGDFIVSTRLIDPNDHSGQAPMVVSFRVRTDAGKPVVTDLGIMGVWLAIAQRDEFGSYLSAHGGSVASLTENVRSVTARYR
ncbi:MAG TPA: ABC transporter substrate-binding protein [Rhizomicrobium sp.]|jgi:phospholipid transport system substrate-binding protein|nr:ABC transporter substrate-binding protein [Rhizomicrobium sp.]